MKVDRSREFWTPEPLLAGETVFLLAGGPSLRSFDVDRLRGRAVIAINASAYLAPWARILYFTDNGWYEANQEIVDLWAGEVISASRYAKRLLPDKIKRVDLANASAFLIGQPKVRIGRSAGHIAVSVAIACGARRPVLLGYDMRCDGERSHFHDDYHNPDRDLYSREFIPGFKGWRKDAEAVGVQILNATPGSALEEFEKVSIDDVL